MCRRDLRFIVVFCLGLGALVHPGAEAQSPLHRVAVLADAAAHGELYPCRCPGLNSSGLALRASVLRQARTSTYPALIVEGGDFTAPEEDSLRSERFDLFVQSMAMMDYDAVGLGEEDLDLEKKQIQAAASKLPLVCANLADPASWGIPPVRRVERGGFHILITGYVDPSLGMRDLLADPIESLSRVLPPGGADSTIVVLLAHGSEGGLMQVLARFPAIDVAVCGHVLEDGPALEAIGKVPVLWPKPDGRNVVQLTADFSPEGLLVNRTVRTWELKQESRGLPKIDAMVREFETRHGLK
jgi:2',3'-cyclic-nucleotide 2'-phosphodiesterase (5'-nucleotidase family)